MSRFVLRLLYLVLLLPGSVAHAEVFADQDYFVFKASAGAEIALNPFGRQLRLPSGAISPLRDCGNDFVLCFTDDKDFGISWVRRCDDFLRKEGEFSLPGKIVRVLHNYSWWSFDAAPKYIFQIAFGRYLVAIYYLQDSSGGDRPSSLNGGSGFENAVQYWMVGDRPLSLCVENGATLHKSDSP